MMTRYGLVILGLLTALPLLAAEDDDPLVFGVFPYLSTKQLEALYAPVQRIWQEFNGPLH